MNEELQRIADKLDRLRADLSATNSALAAVMTVLPADLREAALTHLASLSALKSSTFEQIPTPEARAGARLFLEAEDRVYQLLQGAHRMQAAKEPPPGG